MSSRKSWLIPAAVLLTVAGSAPAPLAAQPALAGSEIQLSLPGGDPPSALALAADPRGGLTAVWQIGLRVFARRYDPQGQPVTGVLPVGEGSGIDAAAVGSGFAVVGLMTSETYPIRLGQVYDRTGHPVGDPFRIETPESSPLASAPRVAADAEGRLTVAWVGTRAASRTTEIFLRRFSAAGEPLGPPRRVVRQSRTGVAYIDVAQAPDGRLLVTWLEQGSYQVFGQLLDADGATLTPPFQVSEGKSFYPPAGEFTASGGLLFAWHGYLSSDPQPPGYFQEGVLARFYDSSGQPSGGPLALALSGPLSAPVIATDSHRRVFVVWVGGSAGIQVREIGAGGTAGPAMTNRSVPLVAGTPHAAAGWGNGWVAVAAQRYSPDFSQSRGLSLQRFATRASSGVLRLDRERAAASEGDGPLALRVERREGTRGAVTAAYTIHRAGSPPGEILAAGTVSFADGESNSQNVVVPIADDALPGGRETLLVTLADPAGGALLGSPAEAIVDIRDDDTPSPLLQNAGAIVEAGGASLFLPESTGSPAVTALTRGGFAVFWTLNRHHVPLPSLGSRLFDANDTAVAEQFTVSSQANAFQVTSHPGGGFTVVGNYFGSGLESLGVLGERFDPAGRSLSGTFLLPQMPAAVAAGPSGGLFSLSRTNGRLALLRLGAHGHPLGPETSVTPDPVCATLPPALASDAAGRVAVVWQDGGCQRIFVRRFSAAGKPLGAAVEVDPHWADRRPGRVVLAAAPDGRLVVVWEAEGDGDGRGIFLQRFASSDRPRPQWVVLPANGHRRGDQSLPGVAVQGDGRFLVAWQSPGTGGPKVFGQYFDSTGQPLGSDFALDSRYPAAETAVSLSATPGGSYIAAWKLSTPDTIFARRFTAPPAP